MIKRRDKGRLLFIILFMASLCLIFFTRYSYGETHRPVKINADSIVITESNPNYLYVLYDVNKEKILKPNRLYILKSGDDIKVYKKGSSDYNAKLVDERATSIPYDSTNQYNEQIFILPEVDMNHYIKITKDTNRDTDRDKDKDSDNDKIKYQDESQSYSDIENDNNGWRQVGNKTYYYKNGKKVKEIQKIDGKSYYFDYKTGELYKKGWLYFWPYKNWVYADRTTGEFWTGRHTIGGKVYYFDIDGFELRNITVIHKFKSPNFGYPDYKKGGNNPKEIVIHHWGEDDSTFNGVVNWLCSKKSEVSAHFIVESDKVAQVLPMDYCAWHAGDKKVNQSSIGIECRPLMTKGDFNTVAIVIANI